MRWKFALLLALPSVAWSLSIVAPKEVLDNGEPISFSWSNGNPPYTLKIIVDGRVISEIRDWHSTFNTWTPSKKQCPAGTIVKIRVIDADGEETLSQGIQVVPAEKNLPENNDKWSIGPRPTAFTLTVHEGTKTEGFATHMSSFIHDSGQANHSSFADFVGNTATIIDEQEPTSLLTTSSADNAAASTVGSELSATATSTLSEENASTPFSRAVVATASSSSDVAYSSDTSSVATSSYSASGSSSSSTTSADDSEEDEAMSTETMIGIGIVVVLALLLLGGGLWFYFHRKRKSAGGEDSKGTSKSHKAGSDASDGPSDEEALVGHQHQGQAGDDSQTDSDEAEPPAPKTSSKRSLVRKSDHENTMTDSENDTDAGYVPAARKSSSPRNRSA